MQEMKRYIGVLGILVDSFYFVNLQSLITPMFLFREFPGPVFQRICRIRASALPGSPPLVNLDT